MRYMPTRRAALLALGTLALGPSLLPAPARAQDYPSQGIRIIIPFAAGGAVDLVGRPLAQKLAEASGQSVVIENRPGAGSIIGVVAAIKAPADGYTVLLTTGSMLATPLVNPNAGYDPLRDLVPITQVVYSQGTILATRPTFPADTLKDLVAAAKQEPGKFNYAHTGVGTPPYVAAELFRHYAGISLVPVPYKGTGNVLSDVVANQVDMTFSGIPSVVEFARTRKVKALASTGTRRTEALPDVPTFQELGFREMDIRGYYGLWVPAGTPPERIARMHALVTKALGDPELKRIYAEGALEIIGSTPAEFAGFLARDLDHQRDIVKTLGLGAPQK